ncbi:MAG: transposase [Clostridia bacterium]|nr:transposase [Clostridia bacterium]
MDLNSRKPTRLQEYDYSEKGAYFITICTKDKQKLFGHIVGGGAFDAPKIILSPQGKIVEKYILSTNNIPNLKVDKYVIMPNHIHLLLSIENSNGTSWAPSPTNNKISLAISTLKRFVNKEIGCNVFQRSFYDHVIRNQIDYNEIWEYIENNPAKWLEDKFYTK